VIKQDSFTKTAKIISKKFIIPVEEQKSRYNKLEERTNDMEKGYQPHPSLSPTRKKSWQ